MSHRFSLPTDAEMENLITQFYESMPKPDQSRLSLIENKVLLKARKNKPEKSLNKIPWWIVLVLAGGFVSATWWAGEQWFEGDAKAKVELKLQAKPEIDANNKLPVPSESEVVDDYQQSDTPVIYQRESF